jgi:5'(3')-deoxyribonucleotidase
MKCFLDMDGVIADFVKAIHEAHNRPYCYADPSARGKFEIEPLWGISSKDFWSTDSYEFWDSVKPTPEATAIVDLVECAFGSENIAILTAPSNGSGCVPGKRNWVKRHFPQFHGRIIFTSAEAKGFLAGEGRVLVDDRDKNVADFRKFGGQAILVPRHWNSLHSAADTTVEHLAWELRNLTKADALTAQSR